MAYMEFGKAVSTCFSKYATFSGRASRSEYWWFYLFSILVLIVSYIALFFILKSLSFGSDTVIFVSVLPLIVSLVLFFPSIAVACRRLHDIGRSGWWQLISLTIIGLIPLLIWLFTATRPEGDKYDES